MNKSIVIDESKIVAVVEEMCLESLPPHLYEAWREVLDCLSKTRKELQHIKQVEHCQCAACIGGVIHASDCAVHNAPALPKGTCDCGMTPWQSPFQMSITEG